MSARNRRSTSMNGIPPRRQANACLRCYEKKVKCDMERMGQPCTGCAAQAVECQKRSRKPYPQRRDTTSGSSSPISITESSNSASINLSRDKLPTPPRSVPSSEQLQSKHKTEHFNFSAPFVDGFNGLPGSLPVQHTTGFDHFFGVNDDTSMSGTMPMFDDPQSYDYFAHSYGLQHPSSSPQPYMIPQSPADSMDSDALAYAEAKGCFSILHHAVYEDLIQCYFHFVHPLLPIIDVSDFFEQYIENGSQRSSSLLLLWSMFSVAANFIPESTLQMTGSKDRLDFKRIMYSRAKCLYDLDYEQDKVTLIQSSLLLGCWCSDERDHPQSWHWTGIAISMAQSLGLHRKAESRQYHPAVSSHCRRLTANIWWSCVFRDRWLSFAHDKPLRINSDDCSVPMPGGDCMLTGTVDQWPNLWYKYLPAELPQIASIWLGLLQLSVVLGEIIAANYQPRKSTLSISSTDLLERRVEECLPEKQMNSISSELLMFFESYARLHVEATMIALYKPFSSEFIMTRAANPDSALCKIADSKMRAAATRASGVLDRIHASDTLRFAGPPMVSLLVPAMTIHLLQAKSHDQFTSSWNQKRLELSLLILKSLEDRYPTASLVHDQFTKATHDEVLMPCGLSPIASINTADNSNTTTYIPQQQPQQHQPSSGQSSWATMDLKGLAQQHPWPTPELSPRGSSDRWNLSPHMEQVFFPLDDLKTVSEHFAA